MSNLILTEAARKTERKYKCPFCDYRNTKPKLVDHVDKNHQDMIPKDYTAARVVFNMINKKDHGTCVCGCGRETAWNEDVWRYERYATQQCKDKYVAEMKQRMVRVYGKEHLLNDPDMQEKMLNNRSISGTYKFTHGGEATYVGSYELKLLEFLDKVMGYRVIDIQSPGPTIPYTYKGKNHFWITDQYLIPYNLVFDCKDGGDNPNNREMQEYREKQLAKEDAIRKQGKYNYIRLTNNNFAQLMLVLAELKERMLDIDKSEDPIIRIFESSTINESIFKKNKSKDEIYKYDANTYTNIFNKEEYDKYSSKIKKICAIIKKYYNSLNKSYTDIMKYNEGFDDHISFTDLVQGNIHDIGIDAIPCRFNFMSIEDMDDLDEKIDRAEELFDKIITKAEKECNNIDKNIDIRIDTHSRYCDIVVIYEKKITSSNESTILESSYSKYTTNKLEALYKKKYRECAYAKNYEFSNSAEDRAEEVGTMEKELKEIKDELDKRKGKKKESVEELCSAVMGALVDTNELYGVSYIPKNSFAPEYGITDDINMDYVLTTDDMGNIFGKGKDFFKNDCKSYSVFKYTKPILKNKINFEASNLLEAVTGKKILHPEQLLYDADFEQVMSENIITSIIESSYEATMKKTDYKIPIINKDYILDEYVMFYRDSNGYFVENATNNLRSKSYPSLDSIDKFTIDYISKGKLFG